MHGRILCLFSYTSLFFTDGITQLKFLIFGHCCVMSQLHVMSLPKYGHPMCVCVCLCVTGEIQWLSIYAAVIVSLKWDTQPYYKICVRTLRLCGSPFDQCLFCPSSCAEGARPLSLLGGTRRATRMVLWCSAERARKKKEEQQLVRGIADQQCAKVPCVFSSTSHCQ